MANNAVIEAAKAVNQPQQDGLLAGFVQGIGFLATGLVTRQKEAKKKVAALDKAYTGKTDIKSISDIVYKTKQRVKNGELTVEEGVAALQGFSYDINKYLPEIDQLMKTFADKGFSNATDSKFALLENFVTSYTLGELNQPIKVNGEVIDAFIQTDAQGNLTMMSAEGKQVPFSEVVGELKNMVQKTDGDKGAGYVNTFLGSKFKYGTEGKYEESRDLLLANLEKSMRDDNAKMSMLFDNKYFVKGEEYTFAKHYMETAMSEEERNTVKEGLKGIVNPAARDKAEAMLVMNIMKDDPNTEEDIKGFFNSLIEKKKPVKPGSGPKLGEVFAPLKNDGSANNIYDYKINRLLTLFKEGSDGSELGDLNIYRQDMGDGKIQLKRKNKQGDEQKDEVLGFIFDPTNKDQVIKMLPFIQRLLFGDANEKELYAIKNFEAYLINKPEILTN